MSVLDVGCGTGAITKGIAEAVGLTGLVVGVDRDQGLLERARAHAASLPNLSFELADATNLSYVERFDVATAARTLQWIADLLQAVQQMRRAVKPGGLVVVLDYNHTFNSWDPTPPPEFMEFYATFLSWRASNGWDNEVANHCPALFEAAGLCDIQSQIQDEISLRGDADFTSKTALWAEVIDNVAPTLTSAGKCSANRIDAARGSYEAWRTTDLVRQTLSMKATIGRVPSR